VHLFDPQIQTRKSRSATDAVKPGAPAAGDSTLPLSRREKLPQEKAADKSSLRRQD
jgi:hypothetical protein